MIQIKTEYAFYAILFLAGIAIGYYGSKLFNQRIGIVKCEDSVQSR